MNRKNIVAIIYLHKRIDNKASKQYIRKSYMNNENSEQFHGLNINFDLSRYERNEEGLIQNIEDARDMIRSLHNIILYMGTYAFEELPIERYAEISRYLVGSYLISHGEGQKDPQQEKGIAALRSLLGDDFE